jgi:hypothetical protein
MISHLDTVIPTVTDPFITSRYIGLVSVAAVTAYELCIKDIFYRFSQAKHKVFGSYVLSSMERINGRITLRNIKEDYLQKFGEIYVKRFNKKLEFAEQSTLKTTGKSIRSSYGNIIVWRNQFAHEGIVNDLVTYKEAVDSYQLGKEVIRVLSESMKR